MHTIDSLYNALRQQLSGARAVDTATAVARFNRITGSSDFAAAVDLLAAKLREPINGGGLDSVAIERFPIDGNIRYMDRTYAPAYEPHSARLTATPADGATYVICDYAETPMCLPSNTPPTPAGGISADVVDVGRGDRVEDYAGLEIAGKAVMATGITTEVYNLAVHEFGAACVMTTNMYDWSNLPQRKRSMLDLPDATHLARLGHDPQKVRTAPAFSITYRHAERLRAHLANGPVTIHAFVDAENKAGELLVLDATINGTDLAEEEVWMLAHLCHPKPGANDNGSGVALAVENFRAIAAAIGAGTLPRPRRTLRLLLLPEMSGTQAYMDRFEAKMEKVVAAVNLDMVGANTALTGAYLRLVQTPWSRPTYLNHLGSYLLQKTAFGSTSHIHHSDPVSDWLYAVAPYDKGSDQDVLLNSRFAVPALFFFNWPHRYYHTDLDTPEKLDPGEFARAGVVAATLAVVAASFNSAVADELLPLLQTEAVHGLARLAHHSDPCAPIESSGDSNAHRLPAQAKMEQGALRSVITALPAGERALHERQLEQALTALAPWLRDESILDNAPVPVRLDPWPVQMGKVAKATGKERLATLQATVADFEYKAIAALNYADGKRTVEQIAAAVSGELGSFTLGQAAVWFELLIESGIVAWRQDVAAPTPVAQTAA